VVKEGKNPQVVWDGSTKQTAMNTIMNEITPADNEANITFGFFKPLFY